MESPVVLDKPPEYHGKTQGDERGFPFDEDESTGAWSELAARHPDIAARLRQRPTTWARKRRPSSQHESQDEFGDNFGFDRFPFDDIPPEFREHFPSWNRRFAPREEPQPQSPPKPQTPPQTQNTTATQTEQPGPSDPTPHLPQYGLRNTVDLGQKSAVDPSLVDAEDRNQRSMSAPPDNRTNQPPSMNNHSQEPAPHPPQESSNVRHIPIFVEGRDEPVINRNVEHPAPQQHYGSPPQQHFVPPPQQHYVPPPQPHIDREQYFNDDGPSFHPPPHFTRAFGTPFNKGFRQGANQGPFAQQKVYPQAAYARGASPQRSQSPRQQEEHFVKVPVHHEQTAPRPQPKPQQQPPPPPPQSHPAPQQPPQDHKPQPPSSNDPITIILSIQTDVLNLMTEVENFTGTKKDKRYIYLDEMLTRNLIKLDNIETDGKENIRQARKEAIKCIQKCIAVLEAKADKGTASVQQQDVVMNEQADEQKPENGEVEMKETKADEVAQNTEPTVQVEENKEIANPEANPVDTRPEETKVPEPNAAEVNETASPKKGAKAKKRDKSKDNKASNKDEVSVDVMQVDSKGEKEAMDVDGAASQ